MDNLRSQMLRLARQLADMKRRSRQRHWDCDSQVCAETEELLTRLVIAWDQTHGKPAKVEDQVAVEPIRLVRTPLMQAIAKCHHDRIREALHIDELKRSCCLRLGAPFAQNDLERPPVGEQCICCEHRMWPKERAVLGLPQLCTKGHMQACSVEKENSENVDCNADWKRHEWVPSGTCEAYPDSCYICEIGPRKDGCRKRYTSEENKDSGDADCPAYDHGCAFCKYFRSWRKVNVTK